jgi:naphthalene 1,2-dioxygenase system ferredoxin subunit
MTPLHGFPYLGWRRQRCKGAGGAGRGLTLPRLGGRLRREGRTSGETRISMSWHPVLEAAKLGDGEIAHGEAGGESLALYRVGEAVYATQELCTHAYVSLVDGYLEGTIVECPVHQARFDVTNGKVLDPPANCDLKSFPVKVENGTIYVEVQ